MKTWLFILTIILALCGVIISVPYWNSQEYTVTSLLVVQDNDKTLYEVTTEEGKTLLLENEDMLFIGKFNSSDLSAVLKNNEGECNLKITTRGYRIQLFSAYQNIVKIEVIGETQ